ncbi:heparan-alpha-glucosaminide N-acetyltransferase domain-containing protein [Desulfobulbus sp.]|uniref:heparan-alpha-glucosaminide N-acetyltransferase domain-containing protein n=1 Tax=Desulfobulbus sp. TaxID=895 RepID=UPI0027B98309|nr:heparan-alpha-glucosaminide N-acetyltransferase domain-containing protein [Desulfobulbus sp.]
MTPPALPVAPGPTRGGRLLFVDALRGLAMVVMIEVHVVNALMQPGYRQAPWFYLLNFINGLVAPAFLFIAGFAFLLASQRNLAALRSCRAPLWATLARIGWVWMLGYLLHIPFFSFNDWRRLATPEQWLQFFSVDVLQCIACGLLIILCARLLIRDDRVFLALIGLLGCLATTLAPWLYQLASAQTAQSLPLFLAPYLLPIGSTLFPLPPWFGFMAAGVLAGWWFLRAQEQGRVNRWMRKTAMIGGLLVAVCLPLLFYLKDSLGVIVDERPQPLFFAARLGCVLLLLALCGLICRSRKNLPSWLHAPSQESLMVYCIHLQVLYRPFWEGKSLAMWVGQRCSLVAALLCAGALIALMLALAGGWRVFKQRYQQANQGLLAAALVGGTLVFLAG